MTFKPFRRAALVLLAALSSSLAYAQTAEACSCFSESVLVAPDAPTHPANAGLLLHNDCGWAVPYTFDATVDGASASLVMGGLSGSWTVVGIEPAPVPGQEVVVRQCEKRRFSETCPAEPVWNELTTFIAGDVDLEPPMGSGDVSLSHRYLEEDEQFCSSGDLRFSARVVGLDQTGESHLVYMAELQAPTGEVLATDSDHPEGPIDEIGFGFGLSSQSLAAPPEDLCVFVVVTDLAGNTGEVASACGSELVPEEGTTGGSETTGSDSTSGPPPDTATTADGSSQGSTGDDSSRSGTDTAAQDDAVSQRGCACHSGGAGGFNPGWMLLMFLVPLARRFGESSWCRIRGR